MAGRLFTKTTHKRISRWYKFLTLYNWLTNQPIDFMNLGYVDARFIPPVNLTERDKDPHRYRQLALYLKLLQNAPKNAQSALEVSCGFGGGSDIYARYFSPHSILGIDSRRIAISECRKKFSHNKNLVFKRLNAEALHLIDNTFDVIFCLEASQHYSDWLVFYKNVFQKLNHHGRFYYGDIFDVLDIPVAEALIEQAGLRIMSKENISEGVLRSIEKIDATTGIHSIFEAILVNRHNVNFNYGSRSHRRLQNGELQFLIYEISK